MVAKGDLVAAAPELLAACKAAVDAAQYNDCEGALREVLPQLRAAINKAEKVKP
jgi:hypothetical protein